MNENQRRVILYGDSLILEGVRASLEGCEDVQVLVLNQPLEKPLEELGAYCPAAVIFDMGATQPDFLLSLLLQPGLLLIGIDPETHQARVWSGREEAAVTTTDLVQVIETWPGSTRQRPLWQVHLDRLSQFVSARVAMLRARPRRQKLAFALSAMTVCATLALVVWLAVPPANAPLSGAAQGGPAPEVGLAFAGGILLGFLLLGLGLRWYGSWRNTK